MVYSTATLVVWILYDFSQQYVTVTSVLVGALLILGISGVIAVLLAEAHKWAEAHWVTMHRRILRPERVDDGDLPPVSIHVPACNEPPQLLIETLDALARLDHPDYEVLVIDNNTVEPEVWRPVEEHCRRLGSRFRFFHVEQLAGFKAGDYRDAGESAFKAMCHAEYRGFFHIGMVTRNERNAIIQHCTMTLVRRELLERIGWARFPGT